MFFSDSDPQNISNYIDRIGHSLTSILTCEEGYEIRSHCFRTNNAISVEFRIILVEVYILVKFIRINFIRKLFRTYSEILHGIDVDCCCIGWDGVDVWATERCMFALNRGYNTVNLDLASTSYEYKLAKYSELNKIVTDVIEDIPINAKIVDIDDPSGILVMAIMPGLSVNVPKENEYTIDPYGQHLSVRKDDHGLSLLLKLSFDSNLSIKRNYASKMRLSDYGGTLEEHRTLSYYTYISNVLSGLNPGNDTYDKLVSLFEQRLGIDIEPMIGLELEIPEEFDIECNNPEDTITLIEQYLYEDDNVIELLTIDTVVYEAMQIYGNVRIGREVEMQITPPNGETHAIFDRLLYLSEDDWYVGSLVLKKQV